MCLLKMTRISGEGIWASTVFGNAARHAAVAHDPGEVEMDLLVSLELFRRASHKALESR